MRLPLMGSLKVLLACTFSLALCCGVSKASLIAGVANSQVVTSGTLSVAIVATPSSTNSKSAYTIPSVDTAIGNFASLINFGTIPLASQSLTLSRSAAITASQLTLSYCLGQWNEALGTCSSGKVNLLVLPAGQNTITQSFSLFLAAGSSWRFQLSSTMAGQSASLSVTATTNNVNTTISNG